MKSAFVFVLLAAAAAYAADIPVVGSEQPVALSDIAGTPTMITVVLKGSGARDANLKLLEARSDRIIVLAPNGDIIPYLTDSVEAVELQDGTVEARRIPQMETQVLRAEHQSIVDRAWTRVRDIYEQSQDDQELRIQAATLLALIDDTSAHNYLRQLADSNDIMIQLAAAGALYLVGDNVSESLLRQGLESGNRQARAKAAGLSGLVNYRDAIPFLQIMFQDRAVQLSTPASRALARMGVRDIVPRLLSMIQELHEEKGAAAIFALTKLGDDDVIDQIKYRLLETEGARRLRLVRVLHNLGDPMGLDELQFIYRNYPTLKPEVALVLARDGDWDATQFLRDRLSRREDPTEANLRYRARNAQALLRGGDPGAMAVLQELLRTENEDVTRYVFELMVELGMPRLITLLQPSIENVDREFALNACQTVIALALPDYRERLLPYRNEFSD